MSLLFEPAVQEDLHIGTSTAEVSRADGGTITGTQIGIHSFAVGQVATAGDWDAASIAAGSYTSTSVAVPGAVVGDFALVSLASILTNDLQLTGHVSAADVVRVVLFNPTASPVNLDEGTLSILVFKARS